MQLTLHATRRTPDGASRLVQVISAWFVNTRHAPSKHCKGAGVHGHTATAMHDNEYTPPHGVTVRCWLDGIMVLCMYLQLRYGYPLTPIYHFCTL